jgi:uncharacterized SAM-binding protein YcdF (DUF218 family)
MPLSSKPLRVLLWISLVPIAIALGLFFWGGDLLVASDHVPDHADAAVVLQGSVVAEKTRIAGAISLLQRGVTSRVVLSIPSESYWGQPLAPVARAYLERNYGNDVARQVDFCETEPDVDSTEQEAQALISCAREHQWRSIVVVTSNYHSRRARMIWKRILKTQFPEAQVEIQGVTDPDFRLQWWSTRRSAKIWLLEFSKLVSEAI